MSESAVQFGLTERQTQMLDALSTFSTRRGRMPTFAELGETLGIRSKSSISTLLKALEERGYIKRMPRRDFLQRETGKRSTKEISVAQAATVIDKLKPLARPAGRVAGLDSPIGGKLRALWIAAFDLGLVRDRSDKALLSFIERQTGLSHPNFAREPGAMAPAIEALKKWIARDPDFGLSQKWADGDGRDAKAHVVEAQWRKLGTIGALTSYHPQLPLLGFENYACKVAGIGKWRMASEADFDAVQRALGRWLRKALAARTPDAAEASEP